jgi:hypothetical protein
VSAVVGIYATAFIICLVTGVALAGVLDPRGRWLDLRSLPLGAATAIALLWPLGWLMPVRVAAWVFVGVVLAALAVALVLRARAGGGPRALRDVLATGRADAVVLGIGAVGGMLILAPLLRLGFPSTIAYSNNDGWSYVGIIEWLHGHAFGPTALPDMLRPTTFAPFAQLRDGFGVGFELLASTTMTLTGRDAYEMVNPVSALGLPIALGGWAYLWTGITGRIGWRHGALIAVAVTSPVFLLPFAENYTPQFVSVSFLPLAAATFVHYARRPGVRTAIPAAIGSAAVIGVYPPLLPWLIPTLLLAALIGARWPGDRAGWRDTRAHVGRLRRSALVLAGFVIALVVIAPIQLRHVIRWFSTHTAEAGIPFPRLQPEDYLVWATGNSAPFSYITGSPVPWSVAATALIVVPIFVVGLLLPLRHAESPRRALALVTAGVVIATAIVFITFRLTDPLGYGLYKALITGGAMLAGLLVLSLIPLRDRGLAGIRLLCLAILAAVWIPQSAQLLELSYRSTVGFRATDIQLGRELRTLPPRSTILVEGAAEEPGSFQVRMTQAYFGPEFAERHVEGLGSSSSYITPGGQPQWRPDTPWDYVITLRADAAPFGAGREPVWDNGVYFVSRAPELDATPFGQRWYPQEVDGSGPYQWTSGNVELIVANRSDRERRVTLGMTVASYADARRLTVAPEGAEGTTFTVPPEREGLTRIAVPLTLPPDSTTPIILTPDPGPQQARPPDARTLSIRVQDVELVDR